jgi:heat shock protein HslJ
MKNLLLFLCITLLTGCADLKEDPPMYGMLNSDFQGQKGLLLNRKWVLEAWGGEKTSKGVVLEFKSQKNLSGNYILSGISSVNFYEAGYSFSGKDGMRVHHLSMTEMAGLKADMEFEEEYFHRLSKVISYQFAGTKLVLKSEDGKQMTFYASN